MTQQRWLALTAFALGLLVLWPLGWLTLRVFQHDDFMYVTTAALWPQYPLYTALPFMQMPLLPWLQGTLAYVVPAAQLYPALLILAALMVLGGAAILVGLLKREGASPLFMLLLWLMLLNNRPAIVAASVTSGHALQFVLAMGLLALLLCYPPTRKSALAAGALLGLLVLAKLNSLPLALPVLVWLKPARWFREGLWVALAGFVVMLPFLIGLAEAPQDVWSQNVIAPTINNQMRGVSGFIDGQLLNVLSEVFLLPVFVLILLFVGVAWAVLFVLRRVTLPSPLLLTFFASTLLVTLLPGKVYIYHFVLPYMVLCYLLVSGLAKQAAPVRKVILIASIPALVWTGMIWVAEANSSQQTFGNKLERLERVRVAYLEALATHPHCATQIYTMDGIPALAGPLPVTPQSAVGPFLQRVTGSIGPDSPLYRFVDPVQLLAGRTALLAGYHREMGYEDMLVAETQRRNYTAIPLGIFPIGYGEGMWTLYLPPCEGNKNDRE